MPPTQSNITTPESEQDPIIWDPVFVHAKRETLVIIGLFLLFCLYSISICWFLGYPQLVDSDPNKKLSLVLGMPHWVFWGIFVPWIVVDVVAYWFCFHFMVDDPLDSPDDVSLEDQP